MATVTIILEGICTHVKTPVVEIPHRVVLRNDSGGADVSGVQIPPHLATITIPPALNQSGQQSTQLGLQGSRITIENGTGPFQYGNYEAMPSLREEMDGVAPLPDPDPALVRDGRWPEIAAYFDLTHGTLSACVTALGSAQATAVIETGDDVVRLRLAPLPGVLGPPDNLDFELADGATVVVSNTAEDEGLMARSHFFLHYLLGVSAVNAPQAPVSFEGQLECPPHDATLGAGCSNSDFP